MKKKTGVISAALITAFAIAMSIPIKAGAYIYNEHEYKYYQKATIIEDKSSDGSTTYTNRANGKTYKVNADGTSEGNSDYDIRSGEAFDKYMVQVGSNETISIPMPYNQTLGKLKITKGKKNLAAKICLKNTVENYKEHILKDSATGRFFYRDYITGERVYVENRETDVRVNKAVYKIRLYGKKKGKARIELPVTDKNNNQINKKVINIEITDNDRIFTSVTFGGKSLNLDIPNMKNYIGSGNSQNEIPYITAKKGRFKVKPNKYYSVKAIYMKKAVGFEKKDLNKISATTGSYMVRTQKAIDLNGDGDCNDVIYGIEETPNGNWVYEKIRNGQVVKLSNVPNTLSDTHYSYSREGYGPNYEYYEKEKSNIATTYFIVVYVDKRSGEYRTTEFLLNRRISKK